MNIKIKSFPSIIRVGCSKDLNKNESQKKEFFIDLNNKNINEGRIKKNLNNILEPKILKIYFIIRKAELELIKLKNIICLVQVPTKKIIVIRIIIKYLKKIYLN
jgi:hypothetical protein